MSETLNQVLARLGYVTAPDGCPWRVGKVIKLDGVQVFVGDASEVWAWLRKTGQIP